MLGGRRAAAVARIAIADSPRLPVPFQPSPAQAVDGQVLHHGHQPGFGRGEPQWRAIVDAQIGVLHDILGVGLRAEQAARQGQQSAEARREEAVGELIVHGAQACHGVGGCAVPSRNDCVVRLTRLCQPPTES